MKHAIVVLLGLLAAACQTSQPLDRASTNPACQGYSDGFTERC